MSYILKINEIFLFSELDCTYIYIIKHKITMKTSKTHSTDLKSIPLTQDDINLITYALRRLSESVIFSTMRGDSVNLIEYIERENKAQ